MSFNITLLQYPIKKIKNESEYCLHLEQEFIKAKKENSNLIVFPEYGSIALSSLLLDNTKKQINIIDQLSFLNSKIDFFLETFTKLSKKYQTYTLCPSIPVKEKNKFINTAYFISPKGLIGKQDKFFMTRFEDEVWGISTPDNLSLNIFDTAFGELGIQICFDIEFSIGSHILSQNGAKLILNPSCTETLAGLHRVHTGAKARALENQCFVAVSQTVGSAFWNEAVDINTGKAALYSTSDHHFPNDGVIAKGKLNSIKSLHQKLDFSKIDLVRKNGNVFNFNHHKNILMSLDRPIKIEKILF